MPLEKSRYSSIVQPIPVPHPSKENKKHLCYIIETRTLRRLRMVDPFTINSRSLHCIPNLKWNRFFLSWGQCLMFWPKIKFYDKSKRWKMQFHKNNRRLKVGKASFYYIVKLTLDETKCFPPLRPVLDVLIKNRIFATVSSAGNVV